MATTDLLISIQQLNSSSGKEPIEPREEALHEIVRKIMLFRKHGMHEGNFIERINSGFEEMVGVETPVEVHFVYRKKIK